VQDRGDRLDAVDQARAGADHQAVAVDRPHLRAREVRDHRAGLLDRPVQVKSAGRHQHDVGLGRGHRGVRDLHRAPPTTRPDRFAARRRHQIGHPVTGGERRIHPLDDRHPGFPPPRDPRLHIGQPRPEPVDEINTPVPYARGLCHGHEGAQHVLQRVRIKRQHIGAAAEMLERVVHVPGRQRAHPA
jgi:hypothetical protein